MLVLNRLKLLYKKCLKLTIVFRLTEKYRNRLEISEAVFSIFIKMEKRQEELEV